LKNASAKLWDIGDGVACLEYTSKMNSVDPMTLDLISESLEKVKENFRGLVIGNDSENFCVGANIGVLLFAANCAAWKTIEDVISRGQQVYMDVKFAPFPVVVASSGMALGGGCEILLHADAIQAHIETYSGLVEVGVGVIPGWGGCKEMIIRNISARDSEKSAIAKLGKMFSAIPLVKSFNTMPAISQAFETIVMAKVGKSAEELRDMRILRDSDRISMNRLRVLADAKQRCLELSDGYRAPSEASVYLPGKTARTALEMAIRSFEKQGKATAHDAVIARHLAYVLSGGDTSIHTPLSERALLALELEAFMDLIRTRATLDRLEHMLEHGKPLRN
jgi:3-hydroxyacyl-CoA dehydrogenase